MFLGCLIDTPESTSPHGERLGDCELDPGAELPVLMPGGVSDMH